MYIDKNMLVSAKKRKKILALHTFFITSNCDKITENEEQRAFLKMVIQNKSESSFTDKIQDLVADAKKNIQWKRQYMDLEREKLYAYDAGFEKGLEQGLEQGAK